MAPVDAEFRPGSLIAGRYELLTKLGEGGMGVVFRANDRVLGEEVALKLLRSVAASDPQYAQRLRSEIKLARRISHKNVCRIYEYGEETNHHYIAMELVHGATLRSVVAQRSALPGEEAASIAIQVASGLEAIHEQHVVHRDLKPANVMLDSTGIAKVMDFGIAKRWDVASTQLTETGVVVGTPEYMSPEQAQGFAVDGRSDLYSLGLMLYEMMTGKVAFRGTTPVATLLLHVQATPPLDGPEAARIPAALLAVLRRALAKKPEERYSNAAEMRGALQDALDAMGGTASVSPASQTVRLDSANALTGRAVSGVPTTSSRPRTVPASSRLTRAARRPHVAWIVGLAAAAGIVVLAVSTWMLLRGSQTLDERASPAASSPAASRSPAAEVDGTGGPSQAAATATAAAAAPVTPTLPSTPAVASRTGSLSNRALDREPGADQTRRAAVKTQTETSDARGPTVSLVLDETVFTPGSTAAAPPGMGRLPPGVVVRPADPGARIEATVEPPRLGAGDAYVVRFHLVNLRDSALRLTAASLRRPDEAPTMLRLETKVAGPLTRTFVGETRAVWSAHSGQAAMTFSILLEDGGLYTCALRARP